MYSLHYTSWKVISVQLLFLDMGRYCSVAPPGEYYQSKLGKHHLVTDVYYSTSCKIWYSLVNNNLRAQQQHTAHNSNSTTTHQQLDSKGDGPREAPAPTLRQWLNHGLCSRILTLWESWHSSTSRCSVLMLGLKSAWLNRIPGSNSHKPVPEVLRQHNDV